MAKRRIVMVGTVLLLLVGSLLGGVATASADVVWCDTDLGPMSTTAEAHISSQAAAIQGDHYVPVPVQAVSTAKGGANPNK